MQSYEFEYNGYAINVLDSMNTSGFSSCLKRVSKKIISVQRVSGFSSPEINHSQSEISGNHGIVDHLSYVGGRIVTIEGLIHGNDEQETMDLIEDFCFHWNLPSIPTRQDNGYSRLTFSKPGEPQKYLMAKIHRLPDPERDLRVRNTYTFQVQFRCEDPRIYTVNERSRDLQKAVLASGFPTYFPTFFGVNGWIHEETNLQNIGNWAAPIQYTIRNDGVDDVVNPRLLNATRGEQQKFNMVLQSGESITVDTIMGKAVDQDGNNVLRFETSDSNWLYVNPRGTDTFRLHSDSGLPTATMKWRDTYISAPR